MAKRNVARKKYRRRALPNRRSASPNKRKRNKLRFAKPKKVTNRQRSEAIRPRLMPEQVAPQSDPVKVGFVFSNDPDPMLVERMWALQETGQFEPHAMYWHRGSDLSFPFCPVPFEANRFTRVTLTDRFHNPISRLWFTIVFAWSLMRWVRKNQFPVLHVVYPNMLIAAFIATLGRPVQIVYDVWDVNHKQRMGKFQRWIFKLLLSKTNQVFTTSQAFIDDFLEPNRILKSGAKATHVSNAPYFRPLTARDSKVDKVDRPLVIGCVGNLRVPRQLQMLLDAVEELRAGGRDVRIRLSGAGSRKRMVSDAAESADHIEYTGPYDYRRDVADLYSQLDLVYAVYPLEVFNYKVHVARRFHDAVLSKKPIVVARNTHMGNLVEDQQVGWCIGHESTSELVELLKEVYDDRELLTKKSNNAEAMSSEHSFQAYREVYVDAYCDLAGLTRPAKQPTRIPAPILAPAVLRPTESPVAIA